uniref:BZIP domain-containing protein n=1 Tax=Opuntia streptacantha TaxID=393608 RepID=A0A7C9DDK2_OPUST
MNNHHKPAALCCGGGGGMKKSASVIALQAPFQNDDVAIANNNNRSSVVGDSTAGGDIFGFGNPAPAGGDLSFVFKSQETISGFPTYGVGETPSWYQSPTPQQPCGSATIDSQSSISAGSPTSTLKPKAGDNQVSGSSDDEDAETEAGPCEQSNDHVDVKRIRRMVSNRESARRSRRRKQAHLQELEMQVEQLNGEHVTLYKQLDEATQQLKDATTNHRILKSDVEALRAKVKLAEDMVARGSLSCSLNHLLQTHLGSPQLLNTQTLSTMANLPPNIGIRGPNGSFGGSFSSIDDDNVDHVLNGGNAGSGLVSEAVSSVSELWSWESQVSTLSK